MDNKNYYQQNEEIENPFEKKIIYTVAIIGGLLVLATLYFSIRL